MLCRLGFAVLHDFAYLGYAYVACFYIAWVPPAMKCRGVGVLLGADRDASFTAEKALKHNWFLQARTPWTWIMESDFILIKLVPILKVQLEIGFPMPLCPSSASRRGEVPRRKAKPQRSILVKLCRSQCDQWPDSCEVKSPKRTKTRKTQIPNAKTKMPMQRKSWKRTKMEIWRATWPAKAEGPISGRYEANIRSLGFLHASVAASMMQNEFVLCLFCQSPVVSFNALMVKLIHLLDRWQNRSWGESSSVKEKDKNSEKLRWWNELWQDDSKILTFWHVSTGKVFLCITMPALALKLLYFVTALIPEKKSKANPQQGPGFGLCILKLRNTYKCIYIWHMYTKYSYNLTVCSVSFSL